jgi:F-type H+-transporting ATPase subunit a
MGWEGIHLGAPIVFRAFGVIPVTSSVLAGWLTSAVLIGLALVLRRSLRASPSRLQLILEGIVEFWGGIGGVRADRRLRALVPFVSATFVFILGANWLGTLPLQHVTTTDPDGHIVPLLRTPNADLNLTAAMAVAAVLAAEGVAVRARGLRRYVVSLLWPNPFHWLELVTRPFSLALRLFGNILAGEVMVSVTLALAPAIASAFLGIELFIGAVQALIFSTLALAFVTASAMEDNESSPHADAPAGVSATP